MKPSECIALACIAIFFTGCYANAEIAKINTGIVGREDIISGCGNQSLEASVACLNMNIRGIYKFNITDDSRNLTFEELKEYGGDCRDWSNVYESLAKELGYNVSSIVIRANNASKHRFAIIYNEEGYCSADQKDYHCFLYNRIINVSS